MKRILLLLLFLILNKAIYSQSEKIKKEEIIVISQENHEKLRHDIENYKLLIKKHQKLKEDYESIQKKLINIKQFDSSRYIKKIDTLKTENNIQRLKITDLTISNENLQSINQKKDSAYVHLNKLYLIEKNKNLKKIKFKRNAIVWKISTFFCFVVILVISTDN